jgi:hypothetical protein
MKRLTTSLEGITSLPPFKKDGRFMLVVTDHYIE